MKAILIRFFAIALFLSIGISCNKEDEVCQEKTSNSSCVCTDHYQPVCGCNGITYGNSCNAECLGITEYTAGECN